jgi:hypothetical protein
MIVPARTNKAGRIVPAFLIDEEIAEHILSFKWSLNAHGYLTATRGNDTPMLLHRFVWGLSSGIVPCLIDHINQDKLDNRMENLRAASRSLNALNSGGWKKKSALPKGVYVNGTGWAARVQGKYIGTFRTLAEADEAACNARASLIKRGG